jgi:5-methylcytosine-specific restriction enzyme A
MGGTGWTGTRIVPGDWKRRRKVILRRASGHCETCGAGGKLEVDHIVNVAEGGTHELTNLQALCLACHAAKTKAEQRRGHARRSQRVNAREPHPGLLAEAP